MFPLSLFDARVMMMMMLTKNNNNNSHPLFVFALPKNSSLSEERKAFKLILKSQLLVLSSL